MELLPQLSIFLLGLSKYIDSSGHCPALNMNFQDFGIEYCTPPLGMKEPEQIVDVLKHAKCLGFKEWYIPPSIGCKNPDLPEGVILEYPCGCDFGGTCKASCGPKYRIVGKSLIVCRRDGTWSKLPTCIKKKCQPPTVFPPAVTFKTTCSYEEGEKCDLKCSQNLYRMNGPAFIICDHGQWSDMPSCRRFCPMNKVPEYLKPSTSCHGDSEELCAVSCKNPKLTLRGSPNINCLPSGTWTNVPTCGCRVDLVPPTIQLDASCEMKAGESCSATCVAGYYQKSDKNNIICSQVGEWEVHTHLSITCLKMCPPLMLPDGMQYKKPCAAEKGEECEVDCPSRLLRLTGPNKFRCLPSGEYSQIPGCAAANKCSKSVSSSVKFKSICDFVVGYSCEVECVNSRAVFIGSKTITCKDPGDWDSIPECELFCPKFPEMPNLISSDCNRVKAGGFCEVSCKPGYSPGYKVKIACQENGYWPAKLPNCVITCGQPELSRKVVILNQCSYNLNDICLVGCQSKEYHLVTAKEMKCLSDRKWSIKPICKKVCTQRQFPHDVILDPSCKPFVEGDVCKLVCPDQGYAIVGNNTAVCMKSGSTIFNVKCEMLCKRPPDNKLPKYLKFVGLCDDVLPNKGCKMRCDHKKAIISTPDEIICGSHGKWSKFPTCEIHCNQLTFGYRAQLVGNCDTLSSSICKLKCKAEDHTFVIWRSNKYERSNYLMYKCSESGNWDVLFKAYFCEKNCVAPSTDEIMVAEENHRCYFIGHPCPIKCRDPNKVLLGQPIARCGSNLKWSNLPKCVSVCDPPHFPKGLHFTLSCSLQVDVACSVRCPGNQVVFGPNSVTCLEIAGLLSWSKMGYCRGQCPDVKHPLMIVNDCKREAEKNCLFGCQAPLVVHGRNNLQCSDKGQWMGPVPFCGPGKCILPSALIPDPYLDDCTLEKNSVCYVVCADGPSAAMNGDPKLMCSNSYTFDKTPSCTPKSATHKMMQCPPYTSNAVVIGQDKRNKKINVGTKLQVSCPAKQSLYDSHSFVFCQVFGVWSPPPLCKVTCKTEQLLNMYIVIYELCSNFAGEYCAVKCKDQLKIFSDESSAYCQTNGQWKAPICGTKFPSYCPALPHYLKVVRALTPEIKVVACKDDGLVVSVNLQTVICLPDNRYSTLPQCKTPRMAFSKCPTLTECRENVAGNFGDTCMVHEGKGCKRMYLCNSLGKWDSTDCLRR